MKTNDKAIGKDEGMGGARKAAKRIAIDSIIMGVLTVIMGILLVMRPFIAGATLCMIMGGILMVAGVTAIIGAAFYGFIFSGYSILMGVALLLAGVFSMMRPGIVLEILNVLFGFFVVIDAASSLADGIGLIRAKVKGGIALVIVSIILLALGVFVILGPVTTAPAVLGWLLIADGIADIVLTIALGKKVREVRKNIAHLYDDDVIDIGEF